MATPHPKKTFTLYRSFCHIIIHRRDAINARDLFAFYRRGKTLIKYIYDGSWNEIKQKSLDSSSFFAK